MHMVAFGPVLVVPLAHAVQPRSVVFVGWDETYCPLGQSVHGVHAVALTVFVKPALQGVHLLSVEELPIVERKEPGEHTEYVVHIEASSVVLNVPLGQGLQTGRELVPPDPTKKPALQLQTLSCCDVPASVCVSPIGQGVNGVQAVTFTVVLNVPIGHALQTLSVIVVPCVERNCPGVHCVKAWHIAAFSVVVKPIVPHVAQTRSLVAVPFVCTKSPFGQSV